MHVTAPQQRTGKPRGISRGNLPRRDDAIKTSIYFKIWNTLAVVATSSFALFLRRLGGFSDVACPPGFCDVIVFVSPSTVHFFGKLD